MNKLRAINKKNTEDNFKFNLEDIFAYGDCYSTGNLGICKDPDYSDEYGSGSNHWHPKNTNFIDLKEWTIRDWLKNYDLFYEHSGEWFKYEAKQWIN